MVAARQEKEDNDGRDKEGHLLKAPLKLPSTDARSILPSTDAEGGSASSLFPSTHAIGLLPFGLFLVGSTCLVVEWYNNYNCYLNRASWRPCSTMSFL
jgi:hypothetical protein